MGNFYHMICQIGTTFYQDNCHWVFIRMKLERKSPNKFCVDFIDILVSCPRLLLMSTKKVKSYIRNCYSEAATGSVIWEKVFLEITQNSQENTCARVSFLIKLPRPATLLKTRLWHHLLATASGCSEYYSARQEL